MSRILFTGASGSVGKDLVYFAKSDNTPLSTSITDIEGVDTIVHLAAKSSNIPEELISSNMVYLLEQIHLKKKHKIDNFIFLSTVSVYGNIDVDEVSEETPCFNPGLYGLSKLFGEKLLENMNTNAICLRLPAVLTSDIKSNLIGRMLAAALNNEKYNVYNHNRIFNNAISSKSLYEFIIKVRNQIKGFDIINLASVRDISFSESFNLIKQITCSESEMVISNETRPFFAIDAQKAISKYGFSPDSTSSTIERWVKRMIELQNGVE
jgi:nucleoside-diphosphate-sugar epimerase